MDSTGITIIWLIVLVCCSAYCSATETAFSSLNRIRIKNLAAEGNKKAKVVLDISGDYDKMLSTILIGNNIVNIVASSIATVVFVKFFPEFGITISTVVMTIFVLLFGEITPKSLANESPEKFAMFSAPILKVLIMLFTPLNYLVGLWRKALSKFIKTTDDRTITEKELLTMVEEAQTDGGIDEQECDLIRSAIEFNDLDAEDILTPRVDITAIDEEYTADEVTETFMESGYSRLPIYSETIDNIIGVVNQKDFFSEVVNGDSNISDIVKTVNFVSPSIKISKLIRILQKTKSHIAVVTDEYGGVLGIVTLEDILEELVGEIWDEHDEVIEEIKKISDTEYEFSGSASLDDVFEIFDINFEIEHNTVGGWVMDSLEKMPEVGDTFEFEDIWVTVKKMDSRRIISVNIKNKT
ncbi:MAG: hemolysin family protein [Oscillospiraceae bacterium]